MFSADPSNARTGFYRYPSLEFFCKEVAPNFVRSCFGGVLKIGQVACSRGPETWSMLAMLVESGVPSLVSAFDKNETLLKEAEKAVYNKRELKEDREEGGPLGKLATRSLAHFEPVSGQPDRIQPSNRLRKLAHFSKHDILSRPLKGEAFDVVMANSVISHYSIPDQIKIIANLAAGARKQGLLLFDEGSKDTARLAKLIEHTKWPHTTLEPLRSAGKYQNQMLLVTHV